MIRTHGATISDRTYIYPLTQQIAVWNKIQSQQQELHLWLIWSKLPISKLKNNYIQLYNSLLIIIWNSQMAGFSMQCSIVVASTHTLIVVRMR
jgi:hypothetical protein